MSTPRHSECLARRRGFIERWQNLIAALTLMLFGIVGLIGHQLGLYISAANADLTQTSVRLQAIDALRGAADDTIAHRQIAQLRQMSVNQPGTLGHLDRIESLLGQGLDDNPELLRQLAALEEQERARLGVQARAQTSIAQRATEAVMLSTGLVAMLLALAWFGLRREFRLLRKMEQDLLVSSLHDPLTGLYNRRAFDDHLAHAWERNQRHGAPLSVIMIDFDHFKRINDEHGHLAGDQVLRVIAKRLAGRLRATEILARHGGEEFAVLVAQPLQVSMRIAEQLRQLVARAPVEGPAATGLPASGLAVTISAGVADASVMHSPDALLAAADAALYRAKANQRNCVVAHGAVSVATPQRLDASHDDDREWPSSAGWPMPAPH